MSSTGALAYNVAWEAGRRSNWFIEGQRNAYFLVAAGVANHDETLLEDGIKALEWGFAQQQSDGSFASGDQFHSTSLFVEATARCLLLLHQSSSVPQALRARADALVPHLKAAALWLAARPDGVNKELTHRFFLVGTALRESAALTDDTQLTTVADDLVRQGLKRQTADGVFPERGGGDTQYQSFSIELATRYASVTSNAALRASLGEATRKGVDWLLTKIGRNGEIDYRQNTRTGCNDRDRTGSTKNVGYKYIPMRLVYYVTFWGDDRGLTDIATAVTNYAKSFTLNCG